MARPTRKALHGEGVLKSKAKTAAGRQPKGSEPEHDVRLDPDVTELMTLSANLQRATTRQLRGHWRDRKLSERGSFILELVHAGLDRPGRLIEYFDVLPSTITFETDKLVAAGLLVREADASDRRIVRLRLTDEGRAVHRETTDAINGLLRPMLDRLAPEELANFLATFHKVVDPVLPRKTKSEAGEREAEKPQP